MNSLEVETFFHIYDNFVIISYIMSHTQVPRKRISRLCMADRRLKVRELAVTVGISKDCVVHMLHGIIGH